jgi:hypothetical protein
MDSRNKAQGKGVKLNTRSKIKEERSKKRLTGYRIKGYKAHCTRLAGFRQSIECK